MNDPGQGPPARDDDVLLLAGVTKHYRRGGGIDEVTLSVGRGEVFAFLGPNGAGKTTTIRLVLDLIRPDAGRISIFGLDPRRDGTAVRGRLGYLPGELALYERLTGRELLTHFAHLRGGLAWPEVADLAGRFELELDRPIGSLSKGNRQKVGLVQALMGRPELLILDEPTTGLDPLVQQEVLEVIRSAADRQAAVFLSSHVLSEVAKVADRVGMIRAGRLLSVERVQDLRQRSVHHLEVRLGDGRPLAVEQMDGVVLLERRGDEVELEVTGSLDPIIGELARHHLVDLVVREPSLEELFLRAYGAAPATGRGADRAPTPARGVGDDHAGQG